MKHHNVDCLQVTFKQLCNQYVEIVRTISTRSVDGPIGIRRDSSSRWPLAERDLVASTVAASGNEFLRMVLFASHESNGRQIVDFTNDESVIATINIKAGFFVVLPT